MRIRDVLCIACIVALLAAAGAFADNASRPFVGGADWQFVGESPPNVGLVSMLSGKSTHAGMLTGTGEVFFTPLPKDAALTLVAANGDEIHLIAHGEPDADGVFIGSYRITGGTGRFAEAIGSGDWTAVANADGTVTTSWSGIIGY